MPRRAFMTGAAGVGLAGLLAACGSGPAVRAAAARSGAAGGAARQAQRRTAGQTRTAALAPGEVELATAGWVKAENARPGTTNWVVTGVPVPHAMEGYADHVSAQARDKVTLFVNTVAPTFHVEAYRMGWYQGLGGRLIWKSAEVTGRRQPAAEFTPGINMIQCAWAPSLSFGVDRTWPPGNYLLKLVGSDGQQQFVPLTIRDDASTAAFVVQNSVTTWQAYNLWDGYSLYYGPQGSGQTYANRSRVVSFDRPYALAQVDWANGASDWLGNEFPFLMLAERLGLDMTYWTDVDFAVNPGLLTRHKALISLGHDEYWSASMLDGALAARNAGVNFAFLGANACFRHIRLAASPTGPDRQVICYKVATEDPLYGVDNADVTANWPSGPVPRPESILIGDMYQSNPVDAAMVASDASAWGLAGAGLAAGDAMPHVVGSEFDAYQPGLAGPTNLEIWAHSPLVCRGAPGHSDMTWYTQAGGGGVFATGTNWWVNKLGDNRGLFPAPLVPKAIPGVTTPLTTITRNVLSVLGTGPADALRPSVANWQTFYPVGSGSGPPGGIQGA
ncbi:MAG: N,N-dimethylformamidase beta subunit family domain-containing protein [Acidimicrobiales bacterium]